MVLYLPAVLFLLLVPIMSEGVELPRSIGVILFSLGYLVLQSRVFQVKRKIYYLPFLLPITYLVSAIANQQNLFEALFGGYKRNFGILTFFGMGIIFLAAFNLNLNNSNKFYKITLLPVSILSIIYAFVQIAKKDFLLWGEQDRVVLSIGNSNFAASYIALLLPTMLYGFAISKSRLYKALNLVLLALLFYSGLRTMSFQFNVVALVSITAFMFITFFHFFARRKFSFKILSTTGLFAITIYTITKYKTVLNEFTNADDRLSQQRAGLEIFRDNFLFGVGVDNLYKYMPLYSRPEDIQREGIDIVPDKTHNVFIDHFANGGVFVGISYLLFILSIFYYIYKILSAGPKFNIDLALPASIFIGYVCQLVINTDSILNMLIPYISMGMIARFYLNTVSKQTTTLNLGRKNQSLSIFGVALIIFIIPLCIRIISTDIEVRNIMNSKYKDGDRVIEILNMWPYPKPTEQVMIKYIQDVNNCPFVDRVATRLSEVDSRSSQALFVKSICADAYGDQIAALTYVKKAIDLQPMNVRYLHAKFQLEKALGYESDSLNTKNLVDSILGVSGTTDQ